MNKVLNIIEAIGSAITDANSIDVYVDEDSVVCVSVGKQIVWQNAELSKSLDTAELDAFVVELGKLIDIVS